MNEQRDQTTVAEARPTETNDPDAVVFRGDGEPKTPELTIERLQGIHEEQGIKADTYSLEGVVGELEDQVASALGKEAAVFMPTGTLANHLAIRQLCGDRRRAIVQEQSHLYRDSGDCATVLSGINLIPLAADRAWFTASELEQVLDASNRGRVSTPVGAVMIESPVRRQRGRVVPLDVMGEISSLCSESGVPTHLDGARLYMMSAATGTPVAEYGALFDTVYVSLYKYFGAPFGGILAGTAEFCDGLYHVRRMFGGGLSQSWIAAALALHGFEGFEERFANAMDHARSIFDRVNSLQGVSVKTLEHGSNIFPLELGDSADEDRFVEALAERRVFVHPDEETGGISLTVNTTILRKTEDEIFDAFKNAVGAPVLAKQPSG